MTSRSITRGKSAKPKVLRSRKFRVPLKPRSAAELPFFERDLYNPQKLLYDTTVYIDVLQSRRAEFWTLR